jgi:hypothetical protein
MYLSLGRDPESYNWLGMDLYENKYVKSISYYYFDRGNISPKQRKLVEDILVDLMRNWYYFI